MLTYSLTTSFTGLMARRIPRGNRLDWFKRLKHKFLTPLGLTAQDLIEDFRFEMRSRRGKRATYTPRRFSRLDIAGSSDRVDLACEQEPMLSSRTNSVAQTATTYSPQMYMVDCPDIKIPWPSPPSTEPLEQRFIPEPTGTCRPCSVESLPRWTSSPRPDQGQSLPTNYLRSWNRYSRRLELCLTTEDPRTVPPRRTPPQIQYAELADTAPRTATRASRDLRRLPSIESSFGPTFGLNQFRSEWLRVSQFEPGSPRQLTDSSSSTCIPED
ncbi:hypothetical protein N7492_000085 [Penicillium capsulatum]|uniref:Uncharacterized protein n=1 Tax=Penicillium capsulatum TaxID=69766 RepID=A0A9W9LZ15_9EURO|nr:hypothetical protein N7492_000085 [Penicillium capsulatum]KAJ6130843.1 hypothetical protein N7512_003623 [Penicillium capsulatum]